MPLLIFALYQNYEHNYFIVKSAKVSYALTDTTITDRNIYTFIIDRLIELS